MTLFLSSSIKDIQLNNIICYDKIKNNIMSNSYFHKLVYSDELCSFNGIFFMFTMKNVNIEKYFNKLKCTISNDKENLATIKDILSYKYNIIKIFYYNYYQQSLSIYSLLQRKKFQKESLNV